MVLYTKSSSSHLNQYQCGCISMRLYCDTVVLRCAGCIALCWLYCGALDCVLVLIVLRCGGCIAMRLLYCGALVVLWCAGLRSCADCIAVRWLYCGTLLVVLINGCIALLCCVCIVPVRLYCSSAVEFPVRLYCGALVLLRCAGCIDEQRLYYVVMRLYFRAVVFWCSCMFLWCGRMVFELYYYKFVILKVLLIIYC